MCNSYDVVFDENEQTSIEIHVQSTSLLTSLGIMNFQLQPTFVPFISRIVSRQLYSDRTCSGQNEAEVSICDVAQR